MNDSKRLSAWNAAGWLGIAGGGAFALMSGAMLALMLVLSARGQDITVHGTGDLPGPMRLVYADARVLPAFFLFASALACSAGIGLVRHRLYGRSLTLVFGAISIAWVLFAVINLWVSLLSPSSNVPSLVFRLGPVLVLTPVAFGYCIAVALLCHSVYSHPEAFTRASPAGAA